MEFIVKRDFLTQMDKTQFNRLSMSDRSYLHV